MNKNNDAFDRSSQESSVSEPMQNIGLGASPFLQIRGLSKSYTHEVTVLKDINIDVRKGELVALLGPSGCGKTTLLNVIAGFQSADQGTITLDGEDISAIPPHKRDMPMVFQDYALIPHMSVLENIEFGLRQRKLPRADVARMATEALQKVQMADFGRRRPSELSGGQQQRVALARALAVKPRVMLLDEPLSNLDALLRVSMREEIKSLLRSVRSTSILVTHDQEEALAFADQIILLNNGLVEQKGSPAFLYNNPATLFAAKFMGFENFLSVDKIHTAMDGVNVQTALGVFKGGKVVGGAVPSACTVAVRAHEFWCTSGADGVDSALGEGIAQSAPATVVSNAFFGQVNRLRVRLGGTEILVADGNPLARQLNSGDTVRLNWRVDSGCLIAR